MYGKITAMTSLCFAHRALIRPLLLVMCLFAVGCGRTDSTMYMKPQLDFSGKMPLLFEARGVKVVSTYKSPMRAPNIEHLMPLSPEKAIRGWVEDRIRTVGGGKHRLRVEIRSAAVTEVALPKSQSFLSIFSSGEKVRLDARVNVALQVINKKGAVRGEATVSSWGSQTVDKGASLSERRVVWFELVRDLMRDVDLKLERSAKDHLSAFMK